MSQEQDRVACMSAAQAWSRRFRLRPAGFSALIDDIHIDVVRYSRLLTVVDRRTVCWKAVPHTGSKRPQAAPVRAEAIDPWNPDPRLMQASRHICTCATCDGSKKVSCPICGGSAKVRCGSCGGSGRSESRKSNKFINCKSCRGSGRMKCRNCTSGRVGCGVCQQHGKLESWLTVETERRGHVGVWPHGAHITDHPQLSAYSDLADKWPGATRVESVDHPRPLSNQDIGPLATALGWPQAAAQPGICPHLDVRRDRIVRQALYVYQTPRARVTFSFSRRAGHVTLFGQNLQVTDDQDLAPFANYRAWMLTGSALAGLLGLAVVMGYRARGPYYADHGSALLAVLVGIALSAGLWSSSRWRRRAASSGSRPRTRLDRIPPTLTVAFTLAAMTAWCTLGPSSSNAAHALASKDLERAEQEIEALERERPPDAELGQLRLELLAAEVADADDRDAVAAYKHAINAEPQLRTQLAPQLADIRLRLLTQAAEAEDLPEVRAQIHELLTEAADPEQRMRVSTEAATIGLSVAHTAFAEHRHAFSLALLDELPSFLPDAQQVHERNHLRAAILRSQVSSCAADDPVCWAQALNAAAIVDPSSTSALELDRLISSYVSQVNLALSATSVPDDRLQSLVTAGELISSLSEITANRHELDALADTISGQRALLVDEFSVVGQRIGFAKALLGADGLRQIREDLWQIGAESCPPDTDVYLSIGSSGRVTGVYVIARSHATQALSPEALNQALWMTARVRLPEDSLTYRGRGIRHVSAKAGKHSVTLGWDDGTLVEAWLGRFKP